MSTLWTKDEVAILRAHYPYEGHKWTGWESLLPGRTVDAIRHKAMVMGLKHGDEEPVAEKPVRRKLNRTRMYIIDESEQRVLTYMQSGLTMAEVDKMCGWPPGRSKRILMEMWRREWSDEDA